MYDNPPERCVHGAVPGVGFMSINAVFCLQSQFEDCTFCTTIQRYCHCVPFDKKFPCITNWMCIVFLVCSSERSSESDVCLKGPIDTDRFIFCFVKTKPLCGYENVLRDNMPCAL